MDYTIVVYIPNNLYDDQPVANREILSEHQHPNREEFAYLGDRIISLRNFLPVGNLPSLYKLLFFIKLIIRKR